MKTYKYLLQISVVIAILLAGCESLDVKNENDPDFATAFSKPSDVKGVASSFVNSWFQEIYNQDDPYASPSLMFFVGADAGTCSWGNFAMRDFSYEPRITWDNTPAYPNSLYPEQFYKTMYSLLSSSNEVLGKVELGNMVIEADDGTDETAMVKAVALLTQGLSLGYIGLTYDKAFIVTEYTDLTVTVPTSPYTDVIDTAVKCLDKCIALCNTETFDVPASWVPGLTLTNVELGELANTVAAVLLSYSPRNAAEDAAVDWASVKTYAQNGLSYDFAPLMDDVSWYAWGLYYQNASGWGQTDMRIINMMDPRFPSRWTDAGTWATLPTPTTSHTAGIDDRVFTDFNYLSTCGFRVERGYYHFTCYRFKRFDTYLSTWTEPVAAFTKTENDLLLAEALLHQPDLTGAAAIINAGTRVTRGHLSPVAANATDIANAIFYERNIELYSAGFGIEFFAMRKADKLQEGTPLHLPIPGQQLEVNIMENYTFGGVGAAQKGVPGIDVSDGGWF